jgi:protein TonB
MSTELKTRGSETATSSDAFGSGFAGSFVLHGAAAALLFGWAFLHHSGQNWGDASSTAGAIQATMVNDIPLPPKPPSPQPSVLATETPSPAPAAPAPRTIEVPKPEAIPIPIKPTKPAKTAEKTAPPPPLHPQPTNPQLNKATTGEASPNITMSSTQTHVGTVSVGIPDSGFGARFAYYREQITQKVAQQWYTGMLDPQAAGHRVYITFQIQRDGTPSNIRVAQASGDATLDRTALSAVQHIDTFGPLPDGYQGSFVNVTYYFDPPPRP